MEKASHRKVTDADGLGGADLKITNHLSRGKTVLETHEGIARIAYLCASLRQKSYVEMAIVVSSSLLSELNYASSTISPNGTCFECACKVLARVLGMLEEVDGIVFTMQNTQIVASWICCFIEFAAWTRPLKHALWHHFETNFCEAWISNGMCVCKGAKYVYQVLS